MAKEAQKKKEQGQSISRSQVERISAGGHMIGGSGRYIGVYDMAVRSNRTAQQTGAQERRIEAAINKRSDLTEEEKRERLRRLYGTAQRTRVALSATGRGYTKRYRAVQFPNSEDRARLNANRSIALRGIQRNRG